MIDSKIISYSSNPQRNRIYHSNRIVVSSKYLKSPILFGDIDITVNKFISTMDIDLKFLEKLNFPDDKVLFEAALSLLVHKSAGNNHSIASYKNLSHEDKIKVTKIYTFLNKAGFAMRQRGDFGIEGLTTALEKYKEKNFILDVLKKIEFDVSLNNYRLIKMSGNEAENKSLLYGEAYGDKKLLEFTKLEWKIEVILSSITMRKV